MIKIAVIACFETEDIELIVPVDIWRRAGIWVDIISLEKKNSIILQSGTKFSCNSIIEKSNLSLYHAIYLPGGNGHKRYFKDAWSAKNIDVVERLHKNLIKFAENEQKYILAMCAAPTILAHLDLLGDNKVTCYPGYETTFKKNYINENVVVNKRMITGKAPGLSFEFALRVIEELVDKKTAKKVKEEIIYN